MSPPIHGIDKMSLCEVPVAQYLYQVSSKSSNWYKVHTVQLCSKVTSIMSYEGNFICVPLWYLDCSLRDRYVKRRTFHRGLQKECMVLIDTKFVLRRPTGCSNKGGHIFILFSLETLIPNCKFRNYFVSPKNPFLQISPYI